MARPDDYILCAKGGYKRVGLVNYYAIEEDPREPKVYDSRIYHRLLAKVKPLYPPVYILNIRLNNGSDIRIGWDDFNNLFDIVEKGQVENY